MKYDEQGREIMDDTPLEKAVQFRRPPTLQEQIQRFVRSELSRQADSQGFETFEEADDFDVGDDYDPRSPHELDEDQIGALSENQQRYEDSRAAQRSRRYHNWRREQPVAKPEAAGNGGKTGNAGGQGGNPPPANG